MNKIPEGYKQTEVGVIPQGWEVKTIGDFTSATAGGTPSTLVPKYWNGDIRWMNSGELNLKTIYEVEGRITEAGLKNSSTKIVPSKCVLIGLAGQGKTRGTAAMNYVELCTNQSIAAIFPNDSFIPEYLFYNIDSRYNELRNLSTGDGGRGGLNLKIIKGIIVPMPTKVEQTAIVSALTDVDALISALEQLITKKRNIKQGAMQQLLTGKKRLPGFGEEWEEMELSEFGTLKGGCGFPIKYQGLSDGKYPFYKVSDMNNKGNEVFMSTSNNYINENIRKLNAIITFPKDTILFAKIGAAIFLERKKILSQASCIDNNMMGFIMDHSKCNTYFFYSLFHSIKLGKLVSTTALPSLSGNEIGKLRLKFPLISEQQAIAQILSDMDAEIQALEQKRDKYKALKQGMMQDLLTGKTRLV